jgi:hypothetical protein
MWLTSAQSGVPYGAAGEFDKNKCFRNDQGYAVKISEDGSWVPEGREQEFHFQACSGTGAQLDDIKDKTDLILLQSGATNANLAAVAYACIFAPEGQDWGLAYPNPKGRCYQELENSHHYIFGIGENQLFQDARALINAIFDHDKVKDNPDFRLLISGYFEFFYAKEDADGDWCDSASFALRKNDRPKLSLALRKKMNELVRGLNDGVKGAVANSSHSDRTEFIDVNSQIEGHRFCQPGHTMLDQYFGDKVYLWNMSPEGIVLDKAGSGSAATIANDTHEVREPTLEEFQHWQETGFFTADHSELPINMSDVANAGLGITPRSSTGGSQFDSLDSTLHEYKSMVLRAFHPKDQGHAAIAQTIVTALKSAPPKKPTPINTDPHYKYSLQVVFAHHGNDDSAGFSWYLYNGPYGKAVDPCYPKNRGFERIIADYPDGRENLRLKYPPFLEFEITWDITLDGVDEKCYLSAQSEEPGFVRCGDWFDMPLSKDAGYETGQWHCNVDSRNSRVQDYHQAWVLEY